VNDPFDKYRSLFPKGTGDWAIVESLAKTNKIDPEEIGTYFGIEAPSFSREFSNAIPRGLGQTELSVGEIASDLGWKDNFIQRHAKGVIERNPSAINSLDDVANYPTAALGLGIGTAVSFVGQQAAGGLAGGGLKLAGALRTGAALQGAAGQTVLAGLPSYAGIREDQRKSGSDEWYDPLVAGAGSGIVGWMENRFGLQKLLKLGATKGEIAAAARETERDAVRAFGATPVRTALKEAGKTVGGEGLEELAQNPVEQLSGYRDPTTRANIEETAFGGVVGALGGTIGIPHAARRGLKHADVRTVLAPYIDPSRPTDLLGAMETRDVNQYMAEQPVDPSFMGPPALPTGQPPMAQPGAPAALLSPAPTGMPPAAPGPGTGGQAALLGGGGGLMSPAAQNVWTPPADLASEQPTPVAPRLSPVEQALADSGMQQVETDPARMESRQILAGTGMRQVETQPGRRAAEPAAPAAAAADTDSIFRNKHEALIAVGSAAAQGHITPEQHETLVNGITSRTSHIEIQRRLNAAIQENAYGKGRGGEAVRTGSQGTGQVSGAEAGVGAVTPEKKQAVPAQGAGVQGEQQPGTVAPTDPYEQAIEIVRAAGTAKIGDVQKGLKIGYAAAKALVDRMEKDGYVSPVSTKGAREIRNLPPSAADVAEEAETEKNAVKDATMNAAVASHVGETKGRISLPARITRALARFALGRGAKVDIRNEKGQRVKLEPAQAARIQSIGDLTRRVQDLYKEIAAKEGAIIPGVKNTELKGKKGEQQRVAVPPGLQENLGPSKKGLLTRLFKSGKTGNPNAGQPVVDVVSGELRDLRSELQATLLQLESEVGEKTVDSIAARAKAIHLKPLTKEEEQAKRETSADVNFSVPWAMFKDGAFGGSPRLGVIRGRTTRASLEARRRMKGKVTEEPLYRAAVKGHTLFGRGETYYGIQGILARTMQHGTGMEKLLAGALHRVFSKQGDKVPKVQFGTQAELREISEKLNPGKDMTGKTVHGFYHAGTQTIYLPHPETVGGTKVGKKLVGGKEVGATPETVMHEALHAALQWYINTHPDHQAVVKLALIADRLLDGTYTAKDVGGDFAAVLAAIKDTKGGKEGGQRVRGTKVTTNQVGELVSYALTHRGFGDALAQIAESDMAPAKKTALTHELSAFWDSVKNVLHVMLGGNPREGAPYKGSLATEIANYATDLLSEASDHAPPTTVAPAPAPVAPATAAAPTRRVRGAAAKPPAAPVAAAAPAAPVVSRPAGIFAAGDKVIYKKKEYEVTGVPRSGGVVLKGEGKSGLTVRDLTEVKHAEPPQYADVEDTGGQDLTLGMGMEQAAMMAMFQQSMYGNVEKAGHVAVKELFQNAADAMKGAIEKGNIESGKIKVDIDYLDRTITVRDDGVGMTFEVVRDAFFKVAGTHKETSRPSGGFGVAKVQFMSAAQTLHLETVRDGVKIVVDTTGADIAKSAAGGPSLPAEQIKRFKTDDPNGTTVIIKLPEKHLNSEGKMVSVEMPGTYRPPKSIRNSPLFENIGVDYAGEEVPIGKSFPADDFVPIATVNFSAWGTARVMISREQRPGVREAHVLSNGVWQFDADIKIPGTDLYAENIPYEVYINLEPTVKAQSPGYPLAQNRQDFSPAAKEDMARLLKFVAQKYGHETLLEDLEGYGHLKSVDAAGTITEEQRLTPPPTTQQKSQGLDIPKGAKVEVRDGKLYVAGKVIPELTKAQMVAFKPADLSEFKIDQKNLDPDKILIHESMQVQDDAGEWVSPTEYGTAKFGDRFGKYLRDVGGVMQQVRSFLVDKIPTFEDLQDVPTGLMLSYSPNSTTFGMFSYVPFQSMMLNPMAAHPQFGDLSNPYDVAEGMISTLVHEATHLNAPNHSTNDFIPKMQQLFVKIATTDPQAITGWTQALTDVLGENGDIFDHFNTLLENPDRVRPFGRSLKGEGQRTERPNAQERVSGRAREERAGPAQAADLVGNEPAVRAPVQSAAEGSRADTGRNRGGERAGENREAGAEEDLTEPPLYAETTSDGKPITEADLEPPGSRALMGIAAALAQQPARRMVQPGIVLGRAKPVPAFIMKSRVARDVENVLRGNGLPNSGGAEALKRALDMIAASGPQEVRALARRISGLLPDSGIILRIDDVSTPRKHGEVRLFRRPQMTLYTAGGRQGLSHEVVMHEALHAIVAARYRTLSLGVVRAGDEMMGTPEPAAARKLEQFEQVFIEFRDSLPSNWEQDPTISSSLKDAFRATEDRDEFFAWALTDPALQEYLASIEYKGTTLWDRFKNWITTTLLGRVGVAPSWLDAALMANNELLGVMRKDAPDFTRLEESNRINAAEKRNAGRGGQAEALSDTGTVAQENEPPMYATAVSNGGAINKRDQDYTATAPTKPWLEDIFRMALGPLYSKTNPTLMNAIDEMGRAFKREIQTRSPYLASKLGLVYAPFNVSPALERLVQTFKKQRHGPTTVANEFGRWLADAPPAKIMEAFDYMDDPAQPSKLEPYIKRWVKDARDALEDALQKSSPAVRAQFDGLLPSERLTQAVQADMVLSTGFGIQGEKVIAAKPLSVVQAIIETSMTRRTGKYYPVWKTGVNGKPELQKMIHEDNLSASSESPDLTTPYIDIGPDQKGTKAAGEPMKRMRPITTVKALLAGAKPGDEASERKAAEAIAHSYVNTVSLMANSVAARQLTKDMAEKGKALGVVFDDDAALLKHLNERLHARGLPRNKLEVNVIQASTQEAKSARMTAAMRMPGNWVQVPLSRAYGDLAGKIVEGPLWSRIHDAMAAEPMLNWQFYNNAVTAFKKSKTVYNPATIATNIMSNFTLAFMNNISYNAVTRGLLLYGRYKIAPGSLSPDELDVMSEFHKSGATLGDFSVTEIKKMMYDAMAEQTEMGGSGVGFLNDLAKFTRYQNSITQKAVQYAKRKGKSIDEVMSEIYATTDNMFRLAAFISKMGELQRTEPGWTHEQRVDEAGTYAKKAFLDYDIDSRAVKALRQTIFPFLSWPYAFAGVMGSIAKNQPWKLATLAAAYTLVSTALSAAMGGDDDEDRKRRAREKKDSTTWFGAYKETYLGKWGGKHLYFDTARWFSPTPIEFKEQPNGFMGWHSWPSALTPGNPAVSMMLTGFGYDPYTGKPLDKDTDAAFTKLTNRVSKAVGTMTPTWAGERLMGPKPGLLGHEPSTAAHYTRLLAAPVTAIDEQESRKGTELEIERTKRAFDTEISNARRDSRLGKRPYAEAAETMQALRQRKAERIKELRERL
jgi:hypothetical protein